MSDVVLQFPPALFLVFFPVLHFPVFRIGLPFSTRIFRPFVLFGPPNFGPAFSVDPIVFVAFLVYRFLYDYVIFDVNF